MAFPYLLAIIGVKILTFLFETYVIARHYTVIKPPTLPPVLEGIISPEKYRSSREYSLQKCRVKFVRLFVTVVLDSGALYFKLFPWLWEKCGGFLLHVGLDPENEIARSLLFSFSFVIWTEISDLTFSACATILVGFHHGHIMHTIQSFIKGESKSTFARILIAFPIGVALIVVNQISSFYFPYIVWTFNLSIPVVIKCIYPALVEPSLTKFITLPRTRLNKKIVKLASQVRFPLEKLFVDDKSSKSNCCSVEIRGVFFRERILLYHALLNESRQEQAVAVFAHELGHWKLKHTAYKFIAKEMYKVFLFGAYMLIKNSRGLYESFGFQDTNPLFISLVIFLHTVVLPSKKVGRFAVNLLNRPFEYQADAYAKKLGFGEHLRANLIEIQEDSVDTMNPDPWFSVCYCPYPSLVQRMSALDRAD